MIEITDFVIALYGKHSKFNKCFLATKSNALKYREEFGEHGLIYNKKHAFEQFSVLNTLANFQNT